MKWNKILDIREGTYSSDIKSHDPTGNDRGATFTDTQTAWLYLAPHESMFELLDTINHETLHVALKREDLHIETEHVIIRKINQMLYGIAE